jgi:hypothetical protein
MERAEVLDRPGRVEPVGELFARVEDRRLELPLGFDDGVGDIVAVRGAADLFPGIKSERAGS